MKLLKRLTNQLRFCLMLILVLFQGIAFTQENGTIISGRIVSQDGEPLPGVNIVVAGTSTGIITDIDGNYKITVPDGYTKISVSYIGYETQEIDISGKTSIDVTLVPEISELSEVVVIGYSEQKKETLTGSISQLKGKHLVLSPQPNVSGSLAGRFSHA